MNKANNPEDMQKLMEECTQLKDQLAKLDNVTADQKKVLDSLVEHITKYEEAAGGTPGKPIDIHKMIDAANSIVSDIKNL